jgi:BlaI family penicillinase repressor
MARPTMDSLTPRESQIMECLWQAATATADQIREQLADGPHDSSVRTLLRILEDKGYVRHSIVGRTYVYAPVVARASVQSQAASSLLKRLFRGSAANLVLRLLEDDEISPDELNRLAEQVRSIAISHDAPRPRPRKKS